LNPYQRAIPRWFFPEPLPESVAGLSVARRVLWTRGLRDREAAERFLRPSIAHLHDPTLLRDMDVAVERLQRAVKDGERILLYGDYDVDGTTSVVILEKAIQLAGGVVDHFVPVRMIDGYGMRPERIDEAAANGVRLIVSVDTGIRAGAVVEHARSLGIDVIVTDHHLPEAELPKACAVINPNRPDCGYPEKGICGAAVTLKLVHAFLARCGFEPERVRKIIASMLKMVAIATVADVVPLTGENRVIVKCGLDGFTAVNNHGLRALLRVAGFKDGDCPSAGQVAFRIAPRINAAGRLTTAETVIKLFTTCDPEEARALAGELHDLNKDRQDTEAAIVKLIADECERVPVTDADAALVFSAPGWHRGVVGIVASRIVDRYHRPAFVISEDPDTGLAHGSGRSIPVFHLLEALESMPELFSKFGGHKQAAGVTLPIDSVPKFRERLNAWAAARLTPDDFRPSIEIDAVIDLQDLNSATVRDVLQLAPFGFGNPAPVFAIRDVEIAGATVRWEKHVNVGLRQNGRVTFVTAWDWAGRMDELRPGSRVNAAVCLDDRGRDGEWKGTLKSVQAVEAAASMV
jgi:single-stranded-DNA-specific exonuclease